MKAQEEWHDVWIEDGMGEIYKDNDMMMPHVTGDPNNQPHISSWLRTMPCGCNVFFKGYCLHTSTRCEKHCSNPCGSGWPWCMHPHGRILVRLDIEDHGQSISVRDVWVPGK